MPYSTTDLLKLLKDLDHNPKKSLGQNFLINEDVCESITKWVADGSQKYSFSDAGARDEAEVSKKDSLLPQLVVEIGPGLGALTHSLRRLDTDLVLIELDSKFSKYWRDQGVEVIEGDALDVNWDELTSKRSTTLVSNLPYQISSRIVVDRSVNPFGVNRMILMFQKEVAERITASGGLGSGGGHPGKGSARGSVKEYGLLSVIAQSAWKIRKFADVGPKDFYPPPQVGSRILEFERVEPKVNMEKFLVFAKTAFSQRRKMLSKNLSSLFDREKVNTALETIGHKTAARAENLSVDDFQKLFLDLENSNF